MADDQTSSMPGQPPMGVTLTQREFEVLAAAFLSVSGVTKESPVRLSIPAMERAPTKWHFCFQIQLDMPRFAKLAGYTEASAAKTLSIIRKKSTLCHLLSTLSAISCPIL